MKIRRHHWSTCVQEAFGELGVHVAIAFAVKFAEVLEGEGFGGLDVELQFTSVGGIGVSPHDWIVSTWGQYFDITHVPDWVCRCEVNLLIDKFHTGADEYAWLQHVVDELPNNFHDAAVEYIAVHEAAHVVDEIRNDRDSLEHSEHDYAYELILVELRDKYLEV